MRTINISFINTDVREPMKQYALNVPDELANEVFEALCSKLLSWPQYKSTNETELQHYLRVLKFYKDPTNK